MFFTCTAENHEHCAHGDGPVSPRGKRSGHGDEVAAFGSATVAATKGGTARRGQARQLRVDIHCHYHNVQVNAKAAQLKPFEKEPSIVYANQLTRDINMKQMKERGPKLSDVRTRLADMDRMGIDVQAVSPSPSQFYYYADPDFGLALARDVNDAIAEIVAGHPDRFVGLGSVPLQNAKMATRELVRCVKTLGLRGVEICTNVNGIDLADQRLGLDPFFAKAEELGVLILLHPMGFTHADRMTDHYFNNIIGNPLESTLAVSHLIFAGVMDRYPRLKFCVVHGGGYLAHYHARMDHGWKARPDARTLAKKKPSSYLKKFFFDTVTFDSGLLDTLVDRYGARQLLLGSDYPFDMGDDNPVRSVERIEGLSDEQRNLILGGNAARLLKIRRKPSGG
jgi:aminocarboxymuconate-semialdehyde decarboxylase